MFGTAVMHPFKGDVKALLDMLQSCNRCEFISEHKEKWERDSLDLGFDVI